ncbi:MAG: branched-chain amino acid ABC transporter substrate-binding protein [Betaproteobacteria bacterium]
MTRTKSLVSAALLLLAAGAAHAQNIRVGFIDPLSGPFANVGESELRHFQLVADMINARGGILGRKLEIVPFDNKSSPQDSVLQLKSAIDQGVQYITQGNGSNVAHALVDTLAKHNARNPGQAVLYLNYAAVDPALTNEKCSFWHFRFDADADMKMSALSDVMAADKSLSKVYLLNQDYAFGQAVSRAGRAMLAAKRPDIQIVGDDLHPLGKVKDFAPYVAKINASGAQAVITGNWGNDLALLVKASKEAGLKVEYFTYYGGIVGTPPAIGESGVGHVRQVSFWAPNVGTPHAVKMNAAYRERFKTAPDDYWFNGAFNVLEMLARAMEQAKSSDPLPVARALEGLKFQADTGEVSMRADNHQLLQPLFVSTFARVDAKTVKFDNDRTGFGFRVDRKVEAKDTAIPTTCKMERP